MQLIGFKNKVMDNFNSNNDNNKSGVNPSLKNEDNLKNIKTINNNKTHAKVKTNFFMFGHSNNSPKFDEKIDSEKKTHQKFLSNDANFYYNPKKNKITNLQSI